MRDQAQKKAPIPWRQRQGISDRSHLRFQFNGVVHDAINWTLDGFSVKPAAQVNIQAGDSFLVTGIGCGSSDLVRVFLRGEAVRADDSEVSVRIVHSAEKDRYALEEFLVRSAALDAQSSAA